MSRECMFRSVCITYVLYSYIGSVPSTLCALTSLTYVSLTGGSTNHQLTCAPDCLTTATTSYLPARCPTAIDKALCGLTAATNIATLTGYDEWGCSTNGITISDPCGLYSWSAIDCQNDGTISDIYMNSLGITGKLLT